MSKYFITLTVFCSGMESNLETLKEIDEYESKNAMTDEERRALFERRMQIFFRIHATGEKKTRSWASNRPSRMNGPRNNAKAFYAIGSMMT